MAGAGNLQFYTGELNESTLKITGNGGNEIGLTDNTGNAQNKETTLGFQLAGVDIPHPKNHMCEGASCNTTSPYTNLCWIPRCTTAGKVVRVLGLVNGNCPTQTNAEIACNSSSSEGTTTTPSCSWVAAGTDSLAITYSTGAGVLSPSNIGRNVVSCLSASSVGQSVYVWTCAALRETLGYFNYPTKAGSCGPSDSTRGKFRDEETLRITQTEAGNWSWEGTPDKALVEINLYTCSCN